MFLAFPSCRRNRPYIFVACLFQFNTRRQDVHPNSSSGASTTVKNHNKWLSGEKVVWWLAAVGATELSVDGNKAKESNKTWERKRNAGRSENHDTNLSALVSPDATLVRRKPNVTRVWIQFCSSAQMFFSWATLAYSSTSAIMWWWWWFYLRKNETRVISCPLVVLKTKRTRDRSILSQQERTKEPDHLSLTWHSGKRSTLLTTFIRGICLETTTSAVGSFQTAGDCSKIGVSYRTGLYQGL